MRTRVKQHRGNTKKNEIIEDARTMGGEEEEETLSTNYFVIKASQRAEHSRV